MKKHGFRSFRRQLNAAFLAVSLIPLLLCSVLLGIGLGIVFDIFRVIRIIFPPSRKKLPTALSDFLYSIIFGLAVFIFSASAGRGDVRSFYVVGALLGTILYIFTAGNTVTGIISAVCGFIGRIVTKLLPKKKNRDQTENSADLKEM